MSVRKSIGICLGLQLLVSCAAMNRVNAEGRGEIGFDRIRRVLPGKTNKAEIEEWFGRPPSVMPAQGSNGEFWYYQELSHTRASFYFSQRSNVVDTVNWEVFDKDPERDLRTALKTHPNAKWKVKTVDWINPHTVPDECYFQDPKLGVSIAFGRTRKEVTSIWWWDPSRTPAASGPENEKPPKFCIGNQCTDGIPAEEWIRKSNWPLCEVPP